MGQFVKPIAYSADFSLLIEAPNSSTCDRRAERALVKIAEWDASQKLTFSPEKTAAVYFRKARRLGIKRKLSTPPHMHFIGVSIKAVQFAWHLSIVVNAKLNGMAHVAYVEEPMANYVRSVHSLSRRDCGLSGVVVINKLYKLGIERLATYACRCWCQE